MNLSYLSYINSIDRLLTINESNEIDHFNQFQNDLARFIYLVHLKGLHLLPSARLQCIPISLCFRSPLFFRLIKLNIRWTNLIKRNGC